MEGHKNPYNNTISQELVPTFNKFTLDDGHVFDGDTSLPMRGSTLIDIDNDGVDEIFLGGGAGEGDKFFQYTDNKFVNISSQYKIQKGKLENSLAASSVDLDNNGFSDLIVSRDSRITVYYNEAGSFVAKDIEAGLEVNTSPLGLTFGDINKDGFLDIFVSGYIKKELMDGLTNFSEGYGGMSALLLNNGDLSFSNITKDAGLDYVHNTFQGVFVDLNDDNWLDLVVAYDTGEPRIYRNNSDLSFELIDNPYTEKFAYPMGIAVGDYDNNGTIDLFFSNIGSTLPKSMVKGNLPDVSNLELQWFLLKNNGSFQFEEVSDIVNLANYEFSWGGVFADMNNDSKQDLIVAENYVDLIFHKLFPLPGRFLLQNDDGVFVARGKKSGVQNKAFGITPLVSDFNKDGNNDLVWVNIDGPSHAYIQKKTIDLRSVNIRFPENALYIGSKITIETESGKKLTDTYVVGEGLATDQSSGIHFGLGNDQLVREVSVALQDGSEMIFQPRKAEKHINIADYE